MNPFLSLNLEIIIGWPLSPQGSFWAQFIYKIFFFILSSRLYFCSISSHVLAFFTFMFSAYNFEMRAVLGDSIMKKWVFCLKWKEGERKTDQQKWVQISFLWITSLWSLFSTFRHICFIIIFWNVSLHAIISYTL